MRRERWWADWFLREPGDVRGSDQLELAATNFDCQGLEIDWAGVCWGNDFIFDSINSRWTVRRFRGSQWTEENPEHSRFVLNGYRVLLTRARRGQVIWMPKPDGTDQTIDPDEFDRTAEFLIAAGVPTIG
ncbi:MAG: DUF2075 domain-containing protein [Dehalococcoidia bacterium]|nr:DUF2075 domain-containing protein [Dehalococcoidia bacterium]